MKIICSKSNLLAGVQIVSKAVPNKTTMSILECILIDASRGVITLTANDMELGIETTIEGEIAEKGIVALESKMFLDIVRSFQGENNVTIETDENYLATITYEKAVFDIPGKSGEDFSYLPEIERSEPVTISQFTLKEVVRQTIFSIADNDTNKMMGGELFEIKDDVLRVVSLDGHRISIRKILLKESYEPKKVIVPGKTLNEVSKIVAGDSEKMVDIYFTHNHIVFEFDNTTVVSRLIEGEYFKIDTMLSGDYETKITVNKRELLNCISRATLLVKEGDKKPVIITIKDEGMKLEIRSALGKMNEDLEAEKVGKDIQIGFNPKFLIDALRVIDEEKVDIYMLNPKAPCFIKDEEENYIYLVLPVNFTTV